MNFWKNTPPTANSNSRCPTFKLPPISQHGNVAEIIGKFGGPAVVDFIRVLFRWPLQCLLCKTQRPNPSASLSPPATSCARTRASMATLTACRSQVAQPSSAASSRTVPVRFPPTANVDARATTNTCPAAMPDSGLPNHLVSGFHSRGVLPHLKREGGAYFVTFRQADTLPREVLLRFKQERDAILAQAEAATRPLTRHEQEELFDWHSNRVDKYLDAGNGTCFLRDPALADLALPTPSVFWRAALRTARVGCDAQSCACRGVADARPCFEWHLAQLEIIHLAYNQPAAGHQNLSFLAKRVLRHLIRDDEDLHRCCHYILMNPVNAGLCARPEDWKWSSGYVARPSPAASSRTVPVRSPPVHGGTPMNSPARTPSRKIRSGAATA